MAGLFGSQLAHGLLHVHDQFSVDAHVGGGAADAAGRLMHQHTGMRGQESLALGAGAQQELAHGCAHAQADGRHVRLDKLHGVVNGHACGDGTTRGIDVQPNILLRIFSCQHQHLCADAIGHFVLDFLAHPNDAVFQQTVENRIGGSGRHIFAGHDGQGCTEVAHLVSFSYVLYSFTAYRFEATGGEIALTVESSR